MIYSENASLQTACIHIVGNKLFDEGVVLSKSLMNIEDGIRPILTQYFISPFKSDERFAFFHHSGLDFNFVYKIACLIFDNQDMLYQCSVMLANQLYEQSSHNKINGGEFCVAFFKGIEVDGYKTDAIGLFKSETKDTYLRVVSNNGNNCWEQEKGININKLDKGCLIFNLNREDGFIMAVVDSANRVEAKYWISDFLQASPRSDKYLCTKNFLKAAKSFITKELPKMHDVSRGEQAELMDKTLRFFKENETFDIVDFNEKVVADDRVAINLGRYVESYAAKMDISIMGSFDISESAVKKLTRSMRSIIKLDNNFHIYVHGGERLIQKGYDPTTGMQFYQIFFKEEK